MKVKQQLQLGFGVVLGLLMVMAIFSFYSLNKLDDAIKLAVYDRYPKVVKINKVFDNINSQARAVRTILLTEDKSIIDGQRNVILKTSEEGNVIFSELEKSVKSEKGIVLLGKIVEARKDYRVVIGKYTSLLDQNKKEEAKSLLLTDLRSAQHRYQGAIMEFIHYEEESMNEAADGAVSTVGSAKTILFLLVSLALAIGIFAAYKIMRNLLNQLGGEPSMLWVLPPV